MFIHTFARRWPKLAALFFLLSIDPLAAFGPDPKGVEQSYTPEAESAIAREKIASEPAILLVRVKGLICETCGYGIYRKMRKVPGVDTKRFNKGAKIDVFTQFVTVGLKGDSTIDVPKLIEAVEDAGYEAISVYLVADGQVDASGYRVPELKADLALASGSSDESTPQLIALRPTGNGGPFVATLYPID